MSLLLRSEEAQQVNAKRKSPSLGRPSYYNADIGGNFEISEDFEAVLILLQPSIKQEILQVLNVQPPTSSRTVKRDQLLAECLEADDANLTAMHEELYGESQSIGNIISRLQSDPRFLEVSEVGMLIKDLQLNREESEVKRGRVFNDLVFNNLQRIRLNEEGASKRAQKQRESWKRVLVEYK